MIEIVSKFCFLPVVNSYHVNEQNHQGRYTFTSAIFVRFCHSLHEIFVNKKNQNLQNIEERKRRYSFIQGFVQMKSLDGLNS